MRIETTRFGVLEVDEDKLINLLWGLPGFEDIKRFALIEYKEGPFHWLQAVDEPTLAFVICAPEILGVQYKIPLERKEPLKLAGDEDLAIFNLVSFARNKDIIRFHMHSPLLFNMNSRTGYQWTMDTNDVKTYLVIPEGLSWTEASVDDLAAE